MAITKIKSLGITDGTIATGDIADNAITTAKITDANITTAKVADDAVTNAKVADDAINTAQIADNAVANAQMADNAVGTSEIADDAVTTAKVNPAQTDITSVGTLTSATVSGDLTVDTNSLFVDASADCVSIGTTSNRVGGVNADGSLNIVHSTSGKYALQARADNTGGHGIFVRAGNSTSQDTARFTGYDENNVHMLINGGGQVLIGTATGSGYANRLLTVGDASHSASFIELRTSTSGTGHLLFTDQSAQGTGSYVGYISYDHSTNQMRFYTNVEKKLEINENGTAVFKMKASDGGAETAIWGSGNNSYIQAVSGELYARDSAGNNNLISPHNFEYIPDGASEAHAWAFLNKKSDSNIKTEKDADGKDVKIIDTTEAKDFTYVNVDMMKVVREVEKLTGTKLVYTGNQDGDDGSTVKDNIIADLIKRIEVLENK